MKIIHEITEALLKPINISTTIIFAVCTFVWGLWIASPWWLTFEKSNIYNFMSQVMPELYWGLAAVVIAIIMCYGIWRPSYMSMRISTAAGSLHWMIVSLGFFIGDWQGTDWILTAAISVYCGYVYANVTVNKDSIIFPY